MPRPKKAPRLLSSRPHEPTDTLNGSSVTENVRLARAALKAILGDRRALALHIGQKYQPHPAQNKADLLVEQVLTSWLVEHVPYSPSAEWLTQMSKPVAVWWEGRKSLRSTANLPGLLEVAHVAVLRAPPQLQDPAAPRQRSDRAPSSSRR